MKSRTPIVVSDVNINPSLEQALEHLQVATRSCLAELPSRELWVRLPPARPQVRGGDVEPISDGILDGRRVPTVSDVHVGLPRREKSDDGKVALGGGKVQRRSAVVVAGIRVHPEVEKLLHHRRVTLRGACAELAGGVSQVEHASMLLQQPRDPHEVVLKRVLNRCAPPPILHVGVALGLDQRREDLSTAFRRRQVHRRPVVVVVAIGLNALAQQLLHEFHIAHRRRVGEGGVHPILPRLENLLHILPQ
mmetsp:Transcript_13480/g.38849  ORF Transcript_13480/g.38849 Transcript_13480/m.38849 type:complete len:249 (+) Transcript_13480:1697-2443(+)